MREVANKCLNVRERVEVVEWNKMVSSLPLLSCELSVSVKENPDRKKKKKKKKSCLDCEPYHIFTIEATNLKNLIVKFLKKK